MRRKLEDSWHAIKPELKNAKPTPRDVGNMTLGTAPAVILTWLIHDVAGISVSPEVAIALGSISSYLISRKLRY